MIDIKIEGKSLVAEKLIEIVTPSKVINFYDKVLFFGLNERDQVVLVYCLENNEDEKICYFLEILTDAKGIKDFVSRKITYLDMLKNAEHIFYSIRSNYPMELTKIYAISLKDIPEKYRPSEDSFCPKLTNKNYWHCDIKKDGEWL